MRALATRGRIPISGVAATKVACLFLRAGQSKSSVVPSSTRRPRSASSRLITGERLLHLKILLAYLLHLFSTLAFQLLRKVAISQSEHLNRKQACIAGT